MNALILAEGTGMAGLLSDIGSVFTQAISWVGTCASTIVSTPLFLITFAMGAVSTAVALTRHFIARG